MTLSYFETFSLAFVVHSGSKLVSLKEKSNRGSNEKIINILSYINITLNIYQFYEICVRGIYWKPVNLPCKRFPSLLKLSPLASVAEQILSMFKAGMKTFSPV